MHVLEETRFSRFEAVPWWEQERLRAARVLVIGAGALGNEIIKNLALLGVGRIAIVDMDRIERSNLCRSVLFRDSDEGRWKSECALEAARGVYAGIGGMALPCNVIGDIGLGMFRWAQVVVGALDNREARLFVNRACAQVGRPWLDGGIDVLNGIARGFQAPGTACYECTLSAADWETLRARRSCSLLARRAAENAGTPTTPTTASIVGAIQVQEIVKLLHGMDVLLGRGVFFEGLRHNTYTIDYQISPECPWHETQPAIEAVTALHSQSTLGDIWQWAAARIGEPDALDFSRELVDELVCVACDHRRKCVQNIYRILPESVICPNCGTECAATYLHSVTAESGLFERTPASLGLPLWDILWARRGGEAIGIEIAGDAVRFPGLFGGTAQEHMLHGEEI